ncbi:MAG: hypothetical protein JNN27_08315 [Planctomycetes bacterium]|nr:hypothetical protein [Planctomycetota bacterium]
MLSARTFLLVATLLPAAKAQSWTTLVSRGPLHGGSAASRYADLSHDGRWCGFASAAVDLVAGDTNNADDVFVRDALLGTTERVSVATGGAQASGASLFPALSADGRFVAFQSYATDLVPGDTNGRVDCFVRDRLLGVTERVSVSSSGAQGAHPATFLQPFERLQAISADGRFVAFSSLHNNLVPGDTNATYDIFVRDRANGTTERVSLGAGGVQSSGTCWQPAISADGRFVAFGGGGATLVANDFNNASDVYVVDRSSGALELVSVGLSGVAGALGAGRPALSADGRFVAFVGLAPDYVTGDTNGVDDAFVRDRLLGVTERVSVESSGAESFAPTSQVALSADARFVAFTCLGDNLVFGDSDQRYDVFVRDRLALRTTLASFTDGEQNIPSHVQNGALSGDGRWIAFHSLDAYTAGDVNFDYDVFLRDRFEQGPASYCAARASSAGCVARAELVGDAQLSTPTPLWIDLVTAQNQRSAAFFYGFAPVSAPYLGGVLCVAPPLTRTPLAATGGSPLPTVDCSGAARFDLGARIAAGVDPLLVTGAELYAQWFVRNPAGPSGTASFSDALFVRLLP